MPMPTSSKVAAPQIVKTMKRGERGSINVSIQILPDMNGASVTQTR